MYPPLDAIRRVDDLIKIDFQGLRDSYFTGLLWSAFAVFVGVLLEGPEALKEAVGTVSRTLIPRGRGLMPALHVQHNVLHRFERTFAQLSLVGWILVSAGLAGEGVFEVLVSKADDLAQTFNAILLVEAGNRAGEAQERAAKADLKRVELQLRILQAFGARDLSQEQLGRITSRFSKFAGVKVDVYGIAVGNPYNKSESDESIRIAKQLVGALLAAHVDTAGWILGGGNSCVDAFGASNVSVITRITNGPSDTRLAREIVRILAPEIDTYPNVTAEPIKAECVRPLSMLTKDQLPKGDVGIVIGRKIPQLLTPQILGIESPK